MNYIKQVNSFIKEEERRQNNTISLIASENYVSKDILKAQGSYLTNKYVEGYISNRYYSGCEVIDKIEELGISLAKKVFDAEHANLQPHSGSQANAAAYLAVLQNEDRVLAMDLSAGGHLTHGFKMNFSGKSYNFLHYGVNKKSEMIDYKEVLKIAKEFKPKLIVVGASSYSRFIDFAKFRKIADTVDAYLMTDMAHIAGLVAAKVHPSPVPHSDIVTTTTHKTLRGARGGLILCKKELAKKIDKAVFPGIQGGALVPAVAGKVIALSQALTKDYKKYQTNVVENSKVFASAFKKGRIISNGTDNHQFTLEVNESYGITGLIAEKKLEQLGVVLNRNLIPFDKLNSKETSGIRIGTPAGTTRGIKSKEFYSLGLKMEKLFLKKDNKSEEEVRSYVKLLTKKYPLKLFVNSTIL